MLISVISDRAGISMKPNKRHRMHRDNHREDQKRLKKGPVCALCSYAPMFDRADLKNPDTFAFCPIRKLEIAADSGRRCKEFARK